MLFDGLEWASVPALRWTVDRHTLSPMLYSSGVPPRSSRYCRKLIVPSIICAVCAISVSRSAASAPVTDPADPIETAIAQLSSDQWSQRKAAQARLAQAGEEIRPRLERLEGQTADPDVRQQAHMLLLRLGASPTRVMLNLKDAEPHAAFAQLEEQSGATFRFDPPDLLSAKDLPTATIQFSRKPFWEALLETADRFGLEIRTDSQGWKLARRNDPGARPNSAASGAFLVVGRAFGRTSQHNASGSQIHIDVFPEPRLILVRNARELDIRAADTERGGSLLPYQLFDVALRHEGCAFTATLQSPTDEITRITRCSGMARLTVARPRKLQYPARPGDAGLLDASEKLLDTEGFRCVFVSTRRVGDGYETWLRVSLTTTSIELEPLVRSMEASRLRAFDAAGGPVICKGIAINRGRDAAELRIAWSAAPYRLEWDAPGQSTEVTVPFTLTDMPLR